MFIKSTLEQPKMEVCVNHCSVVFDELWKQMVKHHLKKWRFLKKID